MYTWKIICSIQQKQNTNEYSKMGHREERHKLVLVADVEFPETAEF